MTAPSEGSHSEESKERSSLRAPDGHPLLQGWPLALGTLGLCFVVWLVLYWSSIASAVLLWYNNSAYNHGFLILPISLYLIWDRRDQLAEMAPQPSMLGAGVVLLSSLAWLVARSAGIAEGEHFAIVGVMLGLVMAVLGTRLFFAMLLPMMYLWLLVPTGSFIQPLLQTLALEISAFLLSLSGVPIFTEGYYIEVPTGTYEVAPGCSGLNFILAGLALSPLFGYMMYSSLKKRTIVIVAMLAIAVIANGIRIYGIIGLAEFSNRRIDIVDDHLLYGWGFFAVILLVCGWIGQKFSDPEDEKPLTGRAPAFLGQSAFVKGGAVALVVLSLFPLYRMQAVSSAASSGEAQIQLQAMGGALGEARSAWAPAFESADTQERRGVMAGGVEADVFAALYNYQSDDRELITFANDPTDQEHYRKRGGFNRVIEVDGHRIPWRFVLLRGTQDVRLLAYTYQIDGVFVVSKFKAKLLQSKATLLRGRPDAGLIAFSVAVTDDVDQAEEELRQLLGALSLGDVFQPSED